MNAFAVFHSLSPLSFSLARHLARSLFFYVRMHAARTYICNLDGKHNIISTCVFCVEKCRISCLPPEQVKATFCQTRQYHQADVK